MQQVTSVLKRFGVEPHRLGLTASRRWRHAAPSPEGWSPGRLAERYDVDHMTVQMYLVIAGVVMRSPQFGGVLMDLLEQGSIDRGSPPGFRCKPMGAG